MRKHKNKKSSFIHLTSSKNTSNNSTKRTKQSSIMLQCPTIEDRNAWHDYWQAQGQPWRTEPKISPERQEELRRYRATAIDIENGIFPFKGVKLHRADVEWLLATHEEGCGPVDWNDLNQQKREGLDLRGANLSHTDLRNLPLAALKGGIIGETRIHATEEQRAMAAVNLEGVNLCGAHLERANLSAAQMKDIELRKAYMEEAFLFEAHLEGADLSHTQMKNACLVLTQMRGAKLINVQMEGTDLSRAHLEHVNFSEANLNRVTLLDAHLNGAYLPDAQMRGALLFQAQLEQATLTRAHLEHANLVGANLKGADLSQVHLEDANLGGAVLEGVNLTRAQMDGVILEQVTLGNEKFEGPQLADVQWGTTNLAVVDWSQVHMLGDEHEAYQPMREGRMKDEATRLEDYLRAVRANRQLALALQAQGLNEDASRYAYHAKVLQRQALIHKVLLQGTSKVTLFPLLLIIIPLLVVILPTIILTFIETIEGQAAPEGFWTKLTIYPALLLVLGLLMPLVFIWPKVVASAARSHSRPFSSDLLTFFSLVVPLVLDIILVLEEVPSSLLSLFSPQWWHVITSFQIWWPVWSIIILLFLYQIALYQVPLLLLKLLLRLEAKHPQILTIKGWIQGIRSQFSLLLQQFVDYGQYLLSLFLDVLAGYGYKPWRSLGWYIATILTFALCYYALGVASGPHLTWHEALIVSLTSFHGRGFFAEQFKPGDPLATYAAAEAVVGLVIEASFIATFTQRFFGK